MTKKSKRQIAMDNRRRGRENEKICAELMGQTRYGLYGGEDGFDSVFSAEYKSRKKFVGWGFMEQAVKNCSEGKVPMVVVHVTNQRRTNDLVMLRRCDFEDWYGKLNVEGEQDGKEKDKQ